MNFDIEGKKALVFGASSGLGRAVAMALAREGASVALCGRDARKLAETQAMIAREGGSAIAAIWDLQDVGKFADRFAEVEERLGPVDILFNNTGGPPPTPAAGQSLALWRTHFEAMVASVIAATDLFLPGMRARKFGRIITSTGASVVAPAANLALSNTLRMTLLGWSKTLANEVARDGVTVNVMVPGRIATARTQALDHAESERTGVGIEEVAAQSASSIPVGRYGEAEEFAAAAVFLASRQAAYITGSQLRVDGGFIPSL